MRGHGDIAPFTVTLVPEDMPHVRRAYVRNGRRWLIPVVAVAAAGLAAALTARLATIHERHLFGSEATTSTALAGVAALVIAGPIWLHRQVRSRHGWRKLTALAPVGEAVTYAFDRDGMHVTARGRSSLVRWQELRRFREGRRLILAWGPRGSVYAISTRVLDRELSGRLREVMEDHDVPAG
ncbi:hypothetical protein ACOYW6_03870 [Parablastomonas sp. CN1-191]|uniref:hypothetical protein n=1 Tax=Parablastomonas sp. CN1-191 TaxID=3400908 RepID=UPI003BF84033